MLISRMVSRSDRASREADILAAERRSFVYNYANRVLDDQDAITEILLDLTESEAGARAVGEAIKSAFSEMNKEWEGISTLADLVHQKARERAAAQWKKKIANDAPSCESCSYSDRHNDPFGTGDSPTEFECAVPTCPWGK